MASVLEDWRTAPVSEKLRATLGFLEKVTLSPGEVSPADLLPLHMAGVSDQAIEEALYVCFLFNVIDRLADAFDFPVPSAEKFRQNSLFLYYLGYLPTSIPG